MKISAKLISEKVDYYIDLILLNEMEEPEQNEIEFGEEPSKNQKSEIIDDIMEMDEELQILHDEDEDDIDSEEDLDSKDGKGEKKKDEEESVDEQLNLAKAMTDPKILAHARRIVQQSGGRLTLKDAVIRAARGAAGAII